MSEELDFIALLSSVGDEISVEDELTGKTGFADQVQSGFTNPVQTSYDQTGKVDFTVSVLSPIQTGFAGKLIPEMSAAQIGFETGGQTDFDVGKNKW